MEWLWELLSAKDGKHWEQNLPSRPYIYHNLQYPARIWKKKLSCHKSNWIVEIQLGIVMRPFFWILEFGKGRCLWIGGDWEMCMHPPTNDDGNCPRFHVPKNKISFGFASSRTIITWTLGQLNFAIFQFFEANVDTKIPVGYESTLALWPGYSGR